MELRPYQSAAKQAIIDYWQDGGGNPLVDLATGTGKSVIIATLVRDLLAEYPSLRILMLVHVQELVQQNFMALLRAWPGAPAGIYSAGLGKRDTHHRIVFASIQSVYNKASIIGPRDLVLIDEAHLVPQKGDGMYKRILADLRKTSPDMRVAGFTATPYRLDSGRLDRGNERLFDVSVYSYGIRQGIEDGYLSPLISKATAARIDVSKVERRGGEFVPSSLEKASDIITAEAVNEIIEFGQDRKSWLVFCAGVDHAYHVRQVMLERGISCDTITGDTPNGERAGIIARFKSGQIRCLTNANVLTTGFDAPSVDLIAMLRPTLSTGLYVQICGRGTRLAHGKTDCLVLDFAGNIRRHGPVDCVEVIGKGGGPSDDDSGKVGVDEVRAKVCPTCQTYAALNTRECKICGYQWPHEEKPKHDAKADGQHGILSTERVAPVMLPVVHWRFDRHVKFGSPDSVRVTYMAGIMEYREWLAFEHGGYAAEKARTWWAAHGGSMPFPKTAADAIDRIKELRMPVTISVKPNGKYHDITSRSFAKKEVAA